jgi:hypothetical protein
MIPPAMAVEINPQTFSLEIEYHDCKVYKICDSKIYIRKEGHFV